MLSFASARLRVAVALLAWCAWGWHHAEEYATDVLAWERAAHDANAPHETIPPVATRRAWLDGGVDRRQLAEDISAPIGSVAVIGLPEPTSIADSGDQSDGFARVEPREISPASHPSRVLFGGSPASVRSRTRSSASPRAPPSALRLA